MDNSLEQNITRLCFQYGVGNVIRAVLEYIDKECKKDHNTVDVTDAMWSLLLAADRIKEY